MTTGVGCRSLVMARLFLVSVCLLLGLIAFIEADWVAYGAHGGELGYGVEVALRDPFWRSLFVANAACVLFLCAVGIIAAVIGRWIVVCSVVSAAYFFFVALMWHVVRSVFEFPEAVNQDKMSAAMRELRFGLELYGGTRTCLVVGTVFVTIAAIASRARRSRGGAPVLSYHAADRL